MSIPSTADTILLQLQNVAEKYKHHEPGAREELLNLSQALTASLELPSEAIQRLGWAEPARSAHCRIAIELKLFEAVKESGAQGISARELSSKTSADEVLVARIMKHLAATFIVHETEAGLYEATTFSNALTEPNFRDGIIYTYEVAGPSYRALPNYLKSVSYKNPTELTNGPFQFAHKTQLPFFAWLDQNPPYLALFNSYMSAYRAGKWSWVDPGFYPFTSRIISGFESSISDVLLVDVGGGLGHDLEEIKTKIPTIPGRLILQDRDEVISTLPATKRDFEAQAHDFFTTQIVQGARAYYLHSVLHDWGDEDCIKILKQLKLAMRKTYSKLLINEIVVPDKNATWPVTAMDQLVMVLGAMKERTETQWRSLLEAAGFHITGIWTVKMGTESLIEADLV
ncbi:MAG: hypothetical protein M1822_002344 [Bathelium mastoideum]|nr:MAG: hypothetical protein M1822_002344 [Bathelium mastoideum]